MAMQLNWVTRYGITLQQCYARVDNLRVQKKTVRMWESAEIVEAPSLPGFTVTEQKVACFNVSFHPDVNGRKLDYPELVHFTVPLGELAAYSGDVLAQCYQWLKVKDSRFTSAVDV